MQSAEALTNLLGVKITEREPLRDRTTLRVGGTAAKFYTAETEGDLVDAVNWAERHRAEVRILGGGSNIVVSDAGINGLVIHMAMRGVDAEQTDGTSMLVTAQAGEPWDDFVALSVENGWSGLECMSGIPGLVGATPIQNVGAYGQEVGQTITTVRAFDRAQHAVVELGPEACRFSYRDSLFKSVEPDRYIVLSVTFRLRTRAPATVEHRDITAQLTEDGVTKPTLASVRQAVLSVRRRKSMVLDSADPNARSCGSFFVNPVLPAEEADLVAERANDRAMPRWPVDGGVKLSAAWLIQRAGFSLGERSGGAGLSAKHALAVIAHDAAAAADIVAFAHRLRARVEGEFGVRLIPEPRFWGFAELDDGLPSDNL